MPEIASLIRIDDDIENVYRQVATLEGIAAWFTKASSENYAPGNTLTLFDSGSCEFEVTAMTPNTEIVWHCTSEENIWTNRVRARRDEDTRTIPPRWVV